MRNLIVAALALALPLALAGCSKDKKNEGDADATPDVEVDHTIDGGDVPVEEPVDEPTVEPTTDPTAEPDEDVEEDAEEDVDEDAGEDAADAEDGGGDAPSACPGTDLGTFTPAEHFGGVDTGYNMWMLAGSISSDMTTEPVSFLTVESWVTYGGPSTPGTTTITSWTSYATCNLCIVAYEDCSSSTGCTRYYMAEEATLDLTAVSMTIGDTLSGTLSGVILSEWDPTTDALVTSGAQMCVDTWTFSETLIDAS
jgi:hypothetical protein